MNVTFLDCTNIWYQVSVSLPWEEVTRKISPLIRNAWTIWPACALGCFLSVPVEERVFVASCVWFGWNVFSGFFCANAGVYSGLISRGKSIIEQVLHRGSMLERQNIIVC
ncbi:Mpv17/PMP22 family protein [Aspergillus alliaceus]|uniref:Mpv17/PMP22 family protein n=1 Tax=Petromyces alliaceus TaxID=209559 RepID=UPI0012A7241C|nr:uncharacterized protein BDW43DRAFT_295048 [Aspergillus alliaceus]KAB8227064.1 hypothetical protein BDW43DRAFT_295048 [Aspergillus alliaceus]